MPFEISFPTRHTDAFAATGFVHAGVLLALTEMAYAAFEKHCGVTKPPTTYAVQRATEARYVSPLAWQEGATIRVRTLAADGRGFEQEFVVHSARDGREIARFIHHWSWFDTGAGRTVELTPEVRSALLAG
ncbi:MAG: thioesterase family protein [Thermoanaerobaculia bacterium]|nr:thioesterase family protein [Thermoanaerobaculia bacterium]